MAAGSNLSQCGEASCDRPVATTTDGLRSQFCAGHRPDTDAMALVTSLSLAVIALEKRIKALEGGAAQKGTRKRRAAPAAT